MNLSLQDLRDALASLPACHPGTPTNILAVSIPRGYEIECAFSESAKDEQIDELTRERDDLREEARKCDADATEACAEADRLRQEVAKLQAMLDEVREEGAGTTLRQYAAQAEESRHSAETSRLHREMAEMGLAILRKRKGIEAGYVREARAVMGFLHSRAQAGHPDAQQLLAKIRNNPT